MIGKSSVTVDRVPAWIMNKLSDLRVGHMKELRGGMEMRYIKIAAVGYMKPEFKPAAQIN